MKVKSIQRHGHSWQAVEDDSGMVTVQRDDNAVSTIFHGWEILDLAVEHAHRAWEAQNEPEQRKEIREAQRAGERPRILLP